MLGHSRGGELADSFLVLDCDHPTILLVWLPLAIFFLAVVVFCKFFFLYVPPTFVTDFNYYILLVVIAPFLPPFTMVLVTHLRYPIICQSTLSCIHPKNHLVFKLICLWSDIVLSRLSLFLESSTGKYGVSSCRNYLDMSVPNEVVLDEVTVVFVLSSFLFYIFFWMYGWPPPIHLIFKYIYIGRIEKKKISCNIFLRSQ